MSKELTLTLNEVYLLLSACDDAAEVARTREMYKAYMQMRSDLLSFWSHWSERVGADEPVIRLKKR